MADARAGIDVVVAERGADHLLDEPNFFIRAARRCDAADRVGSVVFLNRLQSLGREVDGRVPGNFLPGVIGRLPNHRRGNPVLVLCVTPSESTFNAGMTVICHAVFVGNHADNLVALEFRFKGAANAAICTGGKNRPIGYAVINDRFLH